MLRQACTVPARYQRPDAEAGQFVDLDTALTEPIRDNQ